MAPAAKSAAAKAAENCPHCTYGNPVAIGGDEDGTTYKCFACGYGYSMPADAESQAAELATVSAEVSTSTLNGVARKYGIDPADFNSREELHSAMVAKGKKMQSAKAAA